MWAFMATVADHIVRRLREAGVGCLFGVPGGGSNLNLIEAAGRAGLPFVLTATETAGAIAALAQAEVTGRPGACLTTLGPGAASAVNGVACAFLDRAPVVVFTDSLPAAARAFEHQRLDQRALFAPITKQSRSLDPDRADEMVELALELAAAGRPGPVHLDCPGDVASAVVAPERPLRIVRAPGGPGAPGERDLAALDPLLSRARRPLVLVGLGARRDEDAAAIRALCGARGVPAMVTYKAKGVVPDGHPWFAGVFTNASVERPLIDESDLLIGIGLDPVELIPRPWTVEAPIVYCGPYDVDDGHMPFAARLVTDVPAAVAHLSERLARSSWDAARVREDVARQRAAIGVSAPGLTAQRVVEIAAGQLAPAFRVAVDAGAHMFPATVLWPADDPNGFLISNGLSTMGFALPAAIGAALAERRRRVAVLTGDGGLLMSAAELLTAARERLPILVIVFNDASLSLIEIKQQQRRYPPSGVALGEVDWAALAGSVGVPAWRADDETGLAKAIAKARDVEGPALVDARIDRSNYGATLRAVRG